MLITSENLHFRNSEKSSNQLSKKFDSALKILALFLIRSYQILGSPIFGGACRFYPTCSCYGTEAFKNHDPKTAFILTFKRVLKCRPLGPYGFDPVPEKTQKYSQERQH